MSDPALSAEQPVAVTTAAGAPAKSALTPVNSELRGALSKTLSRQGRDDFALLLAMLHQDINQKLRITETEEPPPDIRERELASVDFYPKTPLAAEPQHWRQQELITLAAAQQDLSSLRLMQSMHPAPLALQNDPQFISDEVKANCDIFCQLRMREQTVQEIPVDEAQLYDVIQASQAFG